MRSGKFRSDRDVSPVTAIVTGVAGFIGSTLAEALLRRGHKVLGIDSLSDSYPSIHKRRNMSQLLVNPDFTFWRGDLALSDLESLTEFIQDPILVFHMAGEPGVRRPANRNSRHYVMNNIVATHRLLEWVRHLSVVKLVYSSTSSVYGNHAELPLREDYPTRPISDYGMSKLCSESLCRVYMKEFGIPVVILRYFSVFGPRQRPDMAFSRFIHAILCDRVIEIYGDGTQTRDFTYIDDIIKATVASARAPAGEVFNIGSGTTTTLSDAIEVIVRILGTRLDRCYKRWQSSEMRATWANIDRARNILDYQPTYSLEMGLRCQIQWTLRCSQVQLGTGAKPSGQHMQDHLLM